MTNEQKRQVRDALVRYANNFDSQATAAENLYGISASTISQVKNNNWELLSDRLWHHIARQVGFFCGEWQPADTSAYLLLRILFSDAQHFGMAYGISVSEGLGKTFAAGHYTRENQDTLYISCNEQYNRRSFMADVLVNAGVAPKGTVPEMVQQFNTLIESKSEPLIIFDDAHKLKDRVLHMIVLLANGLAGKAGIIIMGNDQMRTRVLEGVRLKKIGYDEIYKTIGRRFITLTTLAKKDVAMICQANGLHDETIIDHITAECNNNLHQVASLIHQVVPLEMAA